MADGWRHRVTRRDAIAAFVGAVTGIGGWKGCEKFLSSRQRAPESLLVNDIHSQLNETRVKAIEHPTSLEDLIGVLRRANRNSDSVCISASRHAMGGQQFATGAVMIDTRTMNSVIDLDTENGMIEVEAGIEWPELVDYLLRAQPGEIEPWTISTKQTGADRLSLGGAVSANAHGRTLTKPPMGADIESLMLVLADGTPLRCSRNENPELFSLVIGGYGLFGIIHSVTMRLARRQKLERTVKMLNVGDLNQGFDQRIKDGYTLGDCQYATDEKSPGFLRLGVFSCYKPVPIDTPVANDQDSISESQWNELTYLAHTDKAKAFKLYSDYYVKTSGQIYWSDTSQIGGYAGDYHLSVDQRMRSSAKATEMITEIDVPRDRLVDFLAAAASVLREHRASDIYGTIRLVQRDTVSFLPWAKEDYACTIFNLHIEHRKAEIDRAADAFRALIDLAIERNGSYYLTYHRWATKRQVESCYPQFAEFMKLKLKYDPRERFQSEWYRHYRQLF